MLVTFYQPTGDKIGSGCEGDKRAWIYLWSNMELREEVASMELSGEGNQKFWRWKIWGRHLSCNKEGLANKNPKERLEKSKKGYRRDCR